MTENSYIPIRKTDIEIGKPLPWSVYDGDRKLLLRRGFVVENQAQIEALAVKGLFRDSSGRDAGGAPRRAPEGSAESGKGEQGADRSVSLDEIKLNIGDPVQLQMQIGQTESRYYVKLIGYLKGKSVLVTAPEAGGNLFYVREGQAFVVRFFFGKNAYAFTANVTRASTIPYPHLHLSYPSHVRGLVVRSGERVSTRLICSVTPCDDAGIPAAAGVITNLSVGGALLVSKTQMGKKGEHLSVKFRINIREIEFFVTVDATICSVSKDGPGGSGEEFSHGLRFEDLPSEEAIALTAYIYQKLVAESSG